MPNPFDPDDYGMDDFNIEDFTSRVDFGDGAEQPPQEDSAGDTGEYTPLPQREPRERKHVRKQQDPRSLRVLRKTLVVLIYLLVITFVSYVVATLGWHWGNDLLALNKEEITASVTLSSDMFTEKESTDDDGNPTTVSVADMDRVASELKEDGLIEYEWLFKLFARVTHKDTNLSQGTFELNTNMDYSALLRNMGSKSTTRATVKIMVPEGYTVKEIIALLAENGVADADALTEAATNYDFDYDFLDDSTLGQANRLEGYLFPDTYEFYKGSDASTALAKLLNNFKTRLNAEDEEGVSLMDLVESSGYSLHDIITIASIIEKETDGVDQTGISSVIFNRLNNTSSGTNGYLQMDSTIQYILDERKGTLTLEDLAIDSPYNTYLYTGLPAGAICSPGLTSVKAALSPDDTNYYYFILGDDGSTHFFNDYNDFLAFRDAQTGEIQEDDTGVVEG